jgi:hypothetical protein
MVMRITRSITLQLEAFASLISIQIEAARNVGRFELRVAGIGLQLGFIFPVGAMQGYLNFKGCAEFDAVLCRAYESNV